MGMKDFVLGQFGSFDDDFCSELARITNGKNVLEIFSGNGLLAKKLADLGCHITSTSILSGMDAHDINLFFDVENIDCITAVEKYKDSHDYLLVSWPTVTRAAVDALDLWGEEKPIIYIGESHMTDPDMRGCVGCATDDFHESLVNIRLIESFKTPRAKERAFIANHSKSAHKKYLETLTKEELLILGRW